LADPVRVAEVLVRLTTGVVTTVGGDGVMNATTAPNAVPEELAAMAQT
jgi:hypothetical protein